MIRQYLFSCQIEVKGEVVEASATAPNKKSAQKKCALEMVVKLYKEWLLLADLLPIDKFQFRWSKNSVIEMRNAASNPLMFKHLK